MPINPLPLLTALLLLVVPGFFLLTGQGRRFGRSVLVGGAFVAVVWLWVYVPGWVLMVRAHFGNPAAAYELARWTEKRAEQLGTVLLWPEEPDVLGGFARLERAAALDYPPAVYALGARLKYGMHVPNPSGAGGDRYPQPEHGQELIDKALRMGYQPTIPEELFYWCEYRK
jgi:hypothetical protein